MNSKVIVLADSIADESVLIKIGNEQSSTLEMVQKGLAGFIAQIFDRAFGRSEAAEAFTEKILARLASARPEWKCSRSGPLLIDTRTEAGPGAINLGHIFSACEAAPEDANGLVEEFLSAILSATSAISEPVELASLLPRLDAALKAPPGEVVHSVNQELVQRFVIDREETMIFLKESKLDELGLTKKELRELAIKNLVRKFPKVAVKQIDDGVYQALGDTNYDASLVLVAGYWDKRQHPISNEFVFAVPARDQLYYCDSKDKKALKTLRHLARTGFKTGAYPITDKLFILRKGELWIFH
jgi:hypothetical protein